MRSTSPSAVSDCGHGLFLRGQSLPEEQLEHPGRDVGDDFCRRHPGVSHLQHGNQNLGHAPSAAAAEDAQAAPVGGSPGGTHEADRSP